MKLRTCAIALALLSPAASAATITVTTLTDTVAVDGQCSLREAFQNAASNSATNPDCAAGDLVSDTIVFNASLFPGSAGLVGVFQIDPKRGPLIAAGGVLSVTPPTNSKLHIVGDQSSRLIEIQQPANRSTSLFRTHLIDGYSSTDGGAILVRSGSILHLEDCDLRNNHADGSGGAIGFDLSTNVLIRTLRTRFYQNSANGDGGAIGGEMSTRVNLDIADSRFIDNSATDGRGGAIFLRMASQQLFLQPIHTISGSIFADNSALAGGAVHMATGNNISNRFDLLIEDSRFSGNQSLAENSLGRGGALLVAGIDGHHAAAVTILRSSFHDNVDHGSAFGYKAGAAFISHADAIVENSLFARNFAGSGSGGLAVVNIGDFLDLPEQPRVLKLRLNSFYENELGVASGNARALDLLVRVANNTVLDGAFYGNLFKSHSTLESQLGCAFESASGDPYLFPGDYNLADRVECAVGNNSVSGDPQVRYEELTNGSHERTLDLEIESEGRDLIPASECLDSMGDPLIVDLLQTERPSDSDNDGIPDCDTGAFEAGPYDKFDDDIFADDFEDMKPDVALANLSH